ncbi:MAG: PadR family transcriptional regulator [Candidatus Latescibacterota bacterium]|jgi:DNA-binding PadR family transcriptional regulator|nr:MAG: PadR family transcriptional regulator [Candidatus Latescibacterota bacterium]
MAGFERLEAQNLTKNFNEALILAILARGEMHGYQIALEMEERSGGLFRFNHGTLYPILHKLEKEKTIAGVWRPEGPKKKRKLYTLTRRGRRYLDWQASEWRRFMETFLSIIEEGES